MWIYYKMLGFVRNIVERITKRECSKCKHCLEEISCDNYRRYCDCVSGFYPTEFEPKQTHKGCEINARK